MRRREYTQPVSAGVPAIRHPLIFRMILADCADA